MKVNEASKDNVLNALQKSSKGRLEYDTKWKEEGRTKEIVDSIKQNLLSLKLSPQVYGYSTNSFKTLSTSKILSSNSSNVSDNGTSNDTNISDDANNSLQSSKNKNIEENVLLSLIEDAEFKNYEKEREQKVKKRVEEASLKLLKKNESILESVEDEMRMIQKKYLLLSIKNQKQYEEDYQKLDQELESLKQTIGSNLGDNKSGNLKLKEIEEKHKLLLRQEEKKRQQQKDLKKKLTDYKDGISLSLQECDNKLKSSKLDVQQSSKVIFDLQHYKTILLGFCHDIEVLLVSKNEFTEQDLLFCQNHWAESQTIKEKFISLLNVTVNAAHQSMPTLSNQTVSQMTPVVPAKTDSKPIQSSSVLAKPKASPNKVTVESPKQLYIKHQMKLIEFEDKCKQFADNPSHKERRNRLQIFVRTTINTICNLSIQHLKGKLVRLLQLFSEKAIDNNGKMIQCSAADYSLHFAINNASKSFINVAYKQKKIAPMLAPVIVILWSNFPMFGTVFLAHLYLNCPYAVPYYPSKDEAQSDSEYLVTCGYQLDKEGKIESDESFHARMFCLIELYSAIIQCNLTRNHPQDMNHAWKWLALVINDQPKPGITALMLDAFLSMCAHKLYKVYGRQFHKMVRFLLVNYFNRIETITQITERQTLMKFKSCLKDIETKLNSSRNPAKDLEPQGLVPNNFFCI